LRNAARRDKRSVRRSRWRTVPVEQAPPMLRPPAVLISPAMWTNLPLRRRRPRLKAVGVPRRATLGRAQRPSGTSQGAAATQRGFFIQPLAAHAHSFSPTGLQSSREAGGRKVLTLNLCHSDSRTCTWTCARPPHGQGSLLPMRRERGSIEA
jgi:hypothetical protein